jgi:hypothetical protein
MLLVFPASFSWAQSSLTVLHSSAATMPSIAACGVFHDKPRQPQCVVNDSNDNVRSHALKGCFPAVWGGVLVKAVRSRYAANGVRSSSYAAATDESRRPLLGMRVARLTVICNPRQRWGCCA